MAKIVITVEDDATSINVTAAWDRSEAQIQAGPTPAEGLAMAIGDFIDCSTEDDETPSPERLN